MVLLGIDIERAERLSEQLMGWEVQIDAVIALVSQAETLSDVSSNAISLLVEIGSDGRVVGHTIRRASRQVAEFRLPPLADAPLPPALRQTHLQFIPRLTANERARAAVLTERIRDARADGRAPSQRDLTQLQRLFDEAIGDEGVRAASLTLALRGYPTEEALALTWPRQVAAVYDHVAQAMVQNETPGQAGLPAGLFPPQYNKWASQPVPVDERGSAVVSGVDDTVFLLQPGELTNWQAVNAVAQWAGPTGAYWFGHALASIFDEEAPDLLPRIGQIVASDPLVAVGFMNQRGAAGAALIPSQLQQLDTSEFTDSINDYATALAAASQSDWLRFDGAALIDSDVRTDAVVNTPGGEPERLLVAPGFDRDFMLQAVTTSFRNRGGDFGHWGSMPAGLAAKLNDPRLIAAQGAVVNDVAAAVVSDLADSDDLSMLLDPPDSFRGDDPWLSAAGDTSSITALLTQAGLDLRASNQVMNYIFERGRYVAMPLGHQLPETTQGFVNEVRTISDERIAHGLSGMLVAAAPNFVTVVGDQVTADHYVAVQLSSPFFATYHTAVVSGAGDELYRSSLGVLDQALGPHLSQVYPSNDLKQTAQFIGVAHGLRHATQLLEAELVDDAAEDRSRMLGVGGLAFGLGAGHAATAVSTAFGVGSLLTGSDNTALDLEKEQQDEVLRRPGEVRRAALLALFGSGLVRTSSGSVVQLRNWDNSFRLVDEDENEIRLDDAGDDPYRFDDLPDGYPSLDALKQLSINGVPLDDVLANIEGIDGDISRAQLATEHQLGG